MVDLIAFVNNMITREFLVALFTTKRRAKQLKQKFIRNNKSDVKNNENA
mgnify:FL=1